MEQITEKIREVAEEILGVDSSDEPIAETVFALPEDFVVDVTIAPDDTGADYASNAAMKLFGLAKSGKIVAPDNIKSPRDLAEKFAKAMTEDGGFPFTVEVAGPGFLNFISSDGYWKQKLAEYGTNFQKIYHRMYILISKWFANFLIQIRLKYFTLGIFIPLLWENLSLAWWNLPAVR